MQRADIIDQLITRKLFGEDECIVLLDGLEEAFLGVTAISPIKGIYDYWKCLEIIIQSDDMDFDEALVGEHSPLYIKKL